MTARLISFGAKTSPSNCGQHHYITFREHLDPKAPLSKWSIAYFSDSVRGCEAFLDKYKAKSYGNPEAGADRKRIEMEEALGAKAECIASDDPRLKENEEVREFQLMTPSERRLMIRDIERSERDLKPAGRKKNEAPPRSRARAYGLGSDGPVSTHLIATRRR